jgi:transcriptional regulator with XRE-family HTH domain
MIGKLIREIMERRKLSYRKIASDLGVDHANLYHSLMNGANPEWKTIENLLDYLGYDFNLIERKERHSVNCPHCQFGWDKLKEMKDKKTTFNTAGGRKPLRISRVDEMSGRIWMKRSTGNETSELGYQELKEVHDKVHTGELDLDPREIDRKIFRWGNYVTGLLKYLGCRRIQ